MYIIDRNQDFYDYLSNVYGVDKGVVFDRRGSERLTDEWFTWFFSFPIYRRYDPKGTSEYFVLEVGMAQFLLRAFDPKRKASSYDDRVVSFSLEVVREFRDLVHRFDTPMSLRHVSLVYRWMVADYEKRVATERFEELLRCPSGDVGRVVDLPILADTKLTKLLDSDRIWKDLLNYLSSLGNDKDVSIPMTDVEKAQVHGFDKRTSFRHPIK